jgi:hypothetical protein
MTNTSVTLEESGIAEAVNNSGNYDSARNRLNALDFATQAQEIRRLSAKPPLHPRQSAQATDRAGSDPPELRHHRARASTALKAKFPTMVCADIFAGYGVCTDKDGTRHWGSTLLALQVAAPFDVYFFNDLNPEATRALAQRAEEIGLARASIHTVDPKIRAYGGKPCAAAAED